jgi:enoyl-[acyl-carrier-protein] reductase (NADH)
VDIAALDANGLDGLAEFVDSGRTAVLGLVGSVAPEVRPSAEEVAAAALFLASDEASFINGTHLFVDNGFTAV